MKAAMWMTRGLWGWNLQRNCPKKTSWLDWLYYHWPYEETSSFSGFSGRTSWIFNLRSCGFIKWFFGQGWRGPVNDQDIANSIFWFCSECRGVNQCWLAQTVVGSNCDGVNWTQKPLRILTAFNLIISLPHLRLKNVANTLLFAGKGRNSRKYFFGLDRSGRKLLTFHHEIFLNPLEIPGFPFCRNH